MEDLSDDLIMKIIRLLPLKSFVLCLGVCKRLRSLINEEPFFLTYTFNVARHFQDDRYICLPRDQREGGMQDSEFSFPIKSSNEFPFSIKSSKKCLYNDQLVYDFEILASCNGLLFGRVIVLYDLHKYYISNPWTRESVPLPPPSYTITRLYAWGLACENYPTNSNSRDNNSNSSSSIGNNNNVASYKIVVVHQIQILVVTNYRFEVFSSEKKEWQLLESIFKSHRTTCRLQHDAVYCSQVLYWQCCDNCALMFNLETETAGHLDLPSKDDNDDGAIAIDGRSKLTKCHGQLHCIRISFTRRRLGIWKMSTTMRDGWLISHNVDLEGAVEKNLHFFAKHPGLALDFPILTPLDMNGQGDDEVLLYYGYTYDCILSYDLKRAKFELVLQDFLHSKWKLIRYTPTNKSISKK